MLVMGLDISSLRTGAVLLSRGGVLAATLIQRGPKTADEYAAEVAEWVRSRAYQPTILAVEVNRWPKLGGGKFIQALQDCAEMRGRILQLLRKYAARAVQASNEPKRRRRRRIELKYADVRDIKAWSQDEIDALAVADSLMAQLPFELKEKEER